MKYLLIIFLLTISLYSSEIRNIQIGPLNRAYFYFNYLPNYSAELGDNKDRVFINFEQSSVPANISQINSSGVIRSISTNKENSNLKSIIEFSSPGRGFTSVPLSYSQSLVVDIFDWDKLDDSEIQFKTSLYAFESNLESTEEELIKAIESGSNDAKFFKALFLINNNRPKEAVPLIFESNKDSLNYPDLQAAIYEILTISENDSLAKKYGTKFSDLTGISSIPRLMPNLEKSDIFIPEYFYEKERVRKFDSEQKEKTVVSLDSSSKTSGKSFIERLNLNPFYLIFVGVAGIIVFLFVLYAYTKWKKETAKKKSQLTKTQFEEEIRKAKENNERKVRSIKKDRESKQQNNPLLNKTYGNNQNDNDLGDLKQRKVRPVKNVEEEKKQSEIEKFLEDYIPVKKKIEEEKEKDHQKIDKVIENFEESIDLSPNEDLAKKIAEQKHKKKKEQLLKLADEKIEMDDKIEDKAKDLGLEKGSLKAKSSIDKLSKDTERLSKLEEKFKTNQKGKE